MPGIAGSSCARSRATGRTGRTPRAPATTSTTWPSPARSASTARALERPELTELQYSEDLTVQAGVEEIFRSRTRDQWQEKLSALDACCEPVLDLDEVASHPQIAARRVLERGKQGRAPQLGEHTEEVLLGIGIDHARIESLKADSVI